MAMYTIELKKVLDEYIDDIVCELEDDSDFDSVEDLHSYVERHIEQRDGCVFLDLHVEIDTPQDILDNSTKGKEAK